MESCKRLDPLLPPPAWFAVLWVTMVLMNERMDIDDDQDIAEGRLLPPAALCTLLSACRGIISRLFFLNPPKMAPSPASIMLVDMSIGSSILAKYVRPPRFPTKSPDFRGCFFSATFFALFLTAAPDTLSVTGRAGSGIGSAFALICAT